MPSVSQSKGTPQFDFRTEPPLKEFQFELSRFSKGISDWSPMFKRIGGVFRAQEKDQFRSEGALGGGRWKALSPEYKAWKERKYPGRKIGVLTGALQKSMTGGSGYSEHVTATTASFGLDDGSKAAPYAKYFAAERPVLVGTALRGRQMSNTVAVWVREEAHHAGLIGTGSKTYTQELPSTDYAQALSAD
jgi:phage gpG-like protein